MSWNIFSSQLIDVHPQKHIKYYLLACFWYNNHLFFLVSCSAVQPLCLHIKGSPPDLNLPAERLSLRWDYSSQNPSGAAATLPLSGRVGVHHAGRVHPGADGQRLLLHAGRGPAGQVVLDPEHLRGPDAPSAAPRGQNTRRRRRRRINGEKRKVQQEN